MGVLAGHTDGVTFIDPRGDGRHLASNSKDQTIKLWDIRRFSNTDAVQQSKDAVSQQRWDYRFDLVLPLISYISSQCSSVSWKHLPHIG